MFNDRNNASRNAHSGGCLAIFGAIAAILLFSLPAMSAFSGRVRGAKASISSEIIVGSGVNISTITATGFAGNGASLTSLDASNMTSGTLGTGITLDLTNLLYSGLMSGSYISGGTFGAVDAGALTNLTPGALAAGLIPSNVIVSSIAVNAVGEIQILNGAITGAKIANNTITDSNIAVGTFNNISIPAANVNAGSLGSAVIASSIAVNAVEDASIVGVAGSKVSGDISGNAANVNGTVAVTNGGTGATDAATARTNLGVAIGSDVQAYNINLDDLADGKLTASKIDTGSLPSDVIASSLAVNSVYTGAIVDSAVTDAKITGMSSSKLSGTISNSLLDNSSVTLQGNTFNGVSQLVQTDASGKLPALDGSQLTNLPSVSHMRFGGYNSTLGVGTTFFITTADADSTLIRMTVTIVSAGEGGTGTVWTCGSGSNILTVTTPAALAEGSSVTATGSAAITSGSLMGGWISSSDETITPTANVICEYTE